jgi:hypothetical protein
MSGSKPNTLVDDVLAQPLNELRKVTIEQLSEARDGLARWADRVRDDKAPFRFRWAVESLRAANVAASSYIMSGLKRAGVLDQVLSEEDRQSGIEWIASLEDGNGSYEDPALLAYQPPGWEKTGEGWPPTGAHKEAMNQYAQGCLRMYGVDVPTHSTAPPPDWPQVDQADAVLSWIQAHEQNSSWVARMIRRLVDWHLADKIGIQPLLDCIDFVYSRQDPVTGHWQGHTNQTFKLLIVLFEPLGLPLPRAARIVDSVLTDMYRPDYDTGNIFPCTEFDSFYDIGVAWHHVPGYREEELLKWAAHRVAHIVQTRIQSDEGIASYRDRCIPTWLQFDMAPELPQGDAFGLGIFSSGFSICVDMLGISGVTKWRDDWVPEKDERYLELGKQVSDALELEQKVIDA